MKDKYYLLISRLLYPNSQCCALGKAEHNVGQGGSCFFHPLQVAKHCQGAFGPIKFLNLVLPCSGFSRCSEGS